MFNLVFKNILTTLVNIFARSKLKQKLNYRFKKFYTIKCFNVT